MIIFDMGTLANDEHRRHFIEKPWDCCNKCYTMLKVGHQYPEGCECGRNPFTWEEDYQSYYDAADKDEPIYPVWFCFNRLVQWAEYYQIWSGRCESTRKKTIDWLMNLCPLKPTYWNEDCWNRILKLRPTGDTRPQEVLFEEWLNEYMFQEKCDYPTLKDAVPVKTVDFVFSSHKQTIEMFRKRGVFVFDCNQGE